MKTFPSYDYTLCNTKECTKKETLCGTSPTARHRKRNTRTASRYSIGKNWNQNVICM